MSDDIGQWYDDKRKQADAIREKIKTTKTELGINCICCCTPCEHYKGQKLEALYRQLDCALYVGD